MRSLIFIVLLTISSLAVAEMPVFELHIKDHLFNPVELVIPAGVKVKLLVKNQDATPEEFESHELNREKIIPGNSEATVYVGPLDPGTYGFFGEFHMDTAQGKLIAK